MEKTMENGGKTAEKRLKTTRRMPNKGHPELSTASKEGTLYWSTSKVCSSALVLGSHFSRATEVEMGPLLWSTGEKSCYFAGK